MSMLTLALEGATYAASVALLRDSAVVAERQVQPASGRGDGGRGGESLVPLIQSCLAEHRSSAREINRVICGAGPGSFTSLRIAASVAKGIAVAAGAEMYGISSLLLTVAGLPGMPRPGLYLSVLPAMRGESFAELITVRESGEIYSEGGLRVVPVNELKAIAARAGAKLIGPGEELDAGPEARGVARLMAAIVAQGPIDIAAWEPAYGRLAEAQVKWEAAHGRSLAP
jgi:tRNA threonylcarbamoyladenosine biosynthesis protein TsaB